MTEEKREAAVDAVIQGIGRIYCHNCEHDGEDCDGCSRKEMGWAISRACAEGIVDDVVEIIKE